MKERLEVERNPNIPGEPDDFIVENLNLAHYVAWPFIKAAEKDDKITFEKDDYISIAYIGLIKAYQNFRPDAFNTKFSTYAIPMIRGEIWRQTRDLAYIVRNKNRKGQKFYTDSLDKPINGGWDKEVYGIDLITSHDDFDQLIINDFLRKLQPHFRKFYELRIVRGLSQTAIGEILGISQISISRIEKELMRMAREYGEDRDVVGSEKGLMAFSKLEKAG